MLKRTRQRHHRHIARVLEAQFPDIAATQPELLAHHYTAAGLAAPAVEYWQRAGQRSSARSAYIEAVAHLTKGLEVLQTLPDTSMRAQHELEMQLALGQALAVTKGARALEVGHAIARARGLCHQVGDASQLFRVLGELGRCYRQRGEYQTGLELLQQHLALAQCQNDAVRLMEAHVSMGVHLYFLGEFVPARPSLEQALALAGPRQDRPRTFIAGEDMWVSCLGFMARVLWMLGYPDQALMPSHEMLTDAQELSHTYSMKQALSHAGMLHRLRREWATAQEWTEAALAITTEQGLGQPLGVLTLDRGEALAAQGQGEAGVAQMRQVLASNRHGMGGEFTHDVGIVSAITDTGAAIVETQRGPHYTVPGNGWKVGDRVQCTTQDHSRCVSNCKPRPGGKGRHPPAFACLATRRRLTDCEDNAADCSDRVAGGCRGRRKLRRPGHAPPGGAVRRITDCARPAWRSGGQHQCHRYSRAGGSGRCWRPGGRTDYHLR